MTVVNVRISVGIKLKHEHVVVMYCVAWQVIVKDSMGAESRGTYGADFVSPVSVSCTRQQLTGRNVGAFLNARADTFLRDNLAQVCVGVVF